MQPLSVLSVQNVEGFAVLDVCVVGQVSVKLFASIKSLGFRLSFVPLMQAKDGALSSYGYCMLASAHMLSIGGVPPLLSRSSRRENPHLSPQQASCVVVLCGQSH